MPRGLLSSPNAGIRRTLEETDHLVHISVHETELRTQVSFHLRHFLDWRKRLPRLLSYF